ncbi:armadillo repeat-containing protein gudu [Ostrinia furnacalis]|uniref:armadillo repeat-containing protein gudu n=1 Tax=Ostrinia furnacalis TaxID=93504 RepID=UPI00103B0CB8|nr:armadillo repeat-containing protein gudu [Ostrinia furnacalis]
MTDADNISTFSADGGQDTVGLPRIVMVTEGSDTSASSASSTSESEDNWADLIKSSEIPPEYWHIQKLVKYMKAGNQTATMVALSCLKDHDLTIEVNQRAIQEIGGLELLVNLLETRDLCCILGGLAVLKDITPNIEIRKKVTDLGAIPLLVGLLSDPARDVQILAAETIANLGRIRKSRKFCRKFGGIPKLIDLLDIKERYLVSPREELNQDELQFLDIARAGAKALWSMSSSQRNREAMRKYGMIPLIAKMLKTIHLDVAVPAVGLLQMCANETSFQLAIQTEKMVTDLITHLANDDKDLKTYCSLAIYKCASDSITRDMIREAGGLELLVEAAQDSTNRPNKPLLAAVTGALWKCANSDASVKRLDSLGAVPILVRLLDDENDGVLTNVAGALAECAKYPPNRDKIRSAGGIPMLIHHLNNTYKPLLENVPLVLMECAKEQFCMNEIDELDGVRLVWSLLKNDSKKVQTNAALALSPCVQNAADSGEMVRSFVGALELTVDLLDSDDHNVLSAVCAAIATIARDHENLAVISDHGVVGKLSKLVSTTDDHLRANLGVAIAYCCDWAQNRQEFGKRGAITPLVNYMTSRDPNVHRATALALYHLSFYSINCVTMHAAGVVQFLLETIGSKDPILQEASAGCLCNIRKLALATEKIKLKQ